LNSPTETGAVDSGTPPGLLGRERELAALTAALEEARSGRARLCLLSGDPGIGKTRLADALAARAADAGTNVRWGHAWEGGGAPAFWPWVQILRGLIRDEEPDRLRQALAGGAPWLAKIVPELREALPDIEPPSAIETEPQRFALFDAIATFLRNSGERRPLAIVLDDLHAADPPSLLALRFTARALRDAHVLVLAAYQESAAHSRPEVVEVFTELAREGTHIGLGPLDASQVAELFELGGAPADPGLVRQVHETSEGNPFFANELVRLLAAEGAAGTAGPAGARMPLPDTIREAVLRRFEPLGDEAVEILTLAAAIGRDFHLPTLERVSGVERDELLGVLDHAIAADLIREVPGVPGQFRFDHGLMRATLYDNLPQARRVQAHGQIGAALEEQYGGDVEPHVAELAHHYLEAAPGGLAQEAVEYASRAGTRAMQLLAYEEAERLFVGALFALDLGERDRERRAELLLAVGEAQVRAGDSSARETLLAAAGAARALGRADLLARAALAFRAFPRSPGLVDEEVVALLEQALEELGETDIVLRARLLARLALQLYFRAGSDRRRRELVDAAIAIARRTGSDQTLGHVLVNAQLATWAPDTRDEALELSREVLELAERIGDRALALTVHNRQIDLLLELDQLAAAGVEIETLDRLAHEAPDPRARAHVALQRSRRASIEGRFDDAAALTREAEVLGVRAGDPVVRLVAEAQHFEHAWMRGRPEDYEVETRRIADFAPGLPVWRAALALVYARGGRAAEARREVDHLAADGFAAIPWNDSWVPAVALLSEACAELGDRERAASLESLLEPFAARNVLSLHGLYGGPVVRFLGLLAGARGDAERAAALLTEARHRAERMGARPVIAILRLDHARLLARSGAGEDREAAAQLAAEAAELAERIGAGGVAERAAELQAELGEAAGGAAGVEEAPRAAARGSTAPATAVLRREGDVWVFEYEERPVRIRDSKGMRYLARLLAAPGAELHALDLVSGGGGGGGGGDGGAAAADAGLEARADAGDAGPLLDADAKSAYRRRVEDLRDEIEEAESFNDPERAARAREEMEMIAEQLAGAVGLGGRDRRAASTSERARVNATRSIRSVLKRIAEYDERLGHELEATVRTGTFCAYEPDPRAPVEWKVDG
jgi:hypothetical protein